MDRYKKVRRSACLFALLVTTLFLASIFIYAHILIILADINVKNTVLAVEDEVALRDTLGDKLKLEDFAVLTAKNGENGLKAALKSHPDLVLPDIIMPKMDGVEMLRELRKDSWGKNASIIILTNYDI